MVKDLCFEIIETCLNNCMFCSSNSNSNKNQIIKYDDFKRVINYFLSTGGIEELSLSGGEPFLHDDLLKMVAYTKSKGIRTVIFTSGVIYRMPLSKEYQDYYLKEWEKHLEKVKKNEPQNKFLIKCINKHYESILNPSKKSGISEETFKQLKDLGLDKIVFDFQAYESDTDHIIMGREETARQALFDSIINASKVGLNIDVHFVPMKMNYQEIGDILELLEIAKVPNISLLNFVPQGRGKNNYSKLQMSDSEIKDFFKLLNEKRKSYSGNIRVGIPLQGEVSHKCNAGLEKLDIKFDGTILPCPAFKEITLDECRRFNIKLLNIYDNLEKVKLPGHGTRAKPLCKQIYQVRKEIK